MIRILKSERMGKDSWSESELLKLKEGLIVYGKQFKLVAELVGTRNAA